MRRWGIPKLSEKFLELGSLAIEMLHKGLEINRFFYRIRFFGGAILKNCAPDNVHERQMCKSKAHVRYFFFILYYLSRTQLRI